MVIAGPLKPIALSFTGLPVFHLEPCRSGFDRLFCPDGSGTTVVTCVCGRTHFMHPDVCSHLEDYSDTRIEIMNLKEKSESESESDKYFAWTKTVCYLTFLEMNLVRDCPCNVIAWLEEQLWANREQVLSLLTAQATLYQQQAEVVILNAST